MVRKRRDDVRQTAVLSNSFGFDGTNTAVEFTRYEE